MKPRLLVLLFASLFASQVPAALAADPSVPTQPEQFQVKERTEVPNTTLQPGSYSIRILDHLRDRVILQVSKSNHVTSTFLAIPASTMANAPVGPIPYASGPKGKSALKGFAFPGGVAVEFVYPKNDAVSIAQANDTRVMAIDPASEGRVPAEKLNQTDMQMITLWMLEPSRVGPGDAKPGISAARYQAPATANTAPVETAQAQPAPAPAATTQNSASTQSGVASQASATPTSRYAPPLKTSNHRQKPVQIAQNDVPQAPVRTHVRPANVKALPHTASMLPLLWLAALASLLTGGLLSLRRVAFQR